MNLERDETLQFAVCEKAWPMREGEDDGWTLESEMSFSQFNAADGPSHLNFSSKLNYQRMEH